MELKPDLRFAVVEYSSKSGKVWRHSEARPNYLADPLREIDPTSFGCYVSALAGEHIPLTSLIVGPTVRVWAPVAMLRKIIKRVTGRWPGYSLEYFKGFDVLMVVHQLSDAHEIAACTQRLRRKLPQLFIIGVATQPFGQLQPVIARDAAARQNFVDYMNACNVFLTVVEETTDWYKSLTATPVVYMPQPYAVAFASAHFVGRAKKEKVLLVAGVTQRDNIRKGQTVAVQLQRLFPDYLIWVPKVADLDYDASGLAGSRFQMLPFEQWREHLGTLGRVRLVINTDYLLTRGRVQTDCAAVGTPSLGANSDGQRDLFPELASRPETSVESLVAQASRLVTQDGYYDSVVRAAADKLKKYDYGESADRIRMLVKTYQRVTSNG